jgi:copper resistance protein C
MTRYSSLFVVTSVVCALSSAPASAHAFLDHASPGVGTTVSGSPSELELTFTEGVVVAFSGVRVATAGGAVIPAGKPTRGPENTLHVRLGRPLKPGTYVVSWHVVSVDTHHTQGSYKFTIAP